MYAFPQDSCGYRGRRGVEAPPHRDEAAVARVASALAACWHPMQLP